MLISNCSSNSDFVSYPDNVHFNQDKNENFLLQYSAIWIYLMFSHDSIYFISLCREWCKSNVSFSASHHEIPSNLKLNLQVLLFRLFRHFTDLRSWTVSSVEFEELFLHSSNMSEWIKRSIISPILWGPHSSCSRANFTCIFSKNSYIYIKKKKTVSTTSISYFYSTTAELCS